MYPVYKAEVFLENLPQLIKGVVVQNFPFRPATKSRRDGRKKTKIESLPP